MAQVVLGAALLASHALPRQLGFRTAPWAQAMANKLQEPDAVAKSRLFDTVGCHSQTRASLLRPSIAARAGLLAVALVVCFGAINEQDVDAKRGVTSSAATPLLVPTRAPARSTIGTDCSFIGSRSSIKGCN